MKRNNDLIREILLIMESHTAVDEILAFTPADFIREFPKISQGEIDEHIRLLTEKGLVESHHNRGGWYIRRVTWDGYDFLANSRNITVWNKVKQLAENASWDTFTFILKEQALAYIKAQING